MQLVPLEDGPAAPLGRVHLVIAIPAPLDGRLPVARGQAVVHPAVDVAELELTIALGVELEVAPDFGVDEVLVPLIHRLDVPATHEGGLWFLFSLCHHATLPA